MRDPFDMLLQVASIVSIPFAILVAAFFLRRIFRESIVPAASLEYKPLSLEDLERRASSGEGGATYVGSGYGPVGGAVGGPVPRNAAVDLEETPREKLEKLRLLLESEQINQLVQYHANSLAQSKSSFKFSLGAATFGFAIICIGVVSVWFIDGTEAYLTVASGAIIDAVAALFFVQSNQARKSMTEFFDKLRLDRQFNESLRLSDSISDGRIQSMLKAQLALYFSGMPKDSDFVNILHLFQDGFSAAGHSRKETASANPGHQADG